MSDENLRAEYNSVSSYAASTVSNRFQTAGLFLTATAFLAGAAFKPEISAAYQLLICAFALITTFCIWGIELRNRQILAMVAGRGREIEQIWLGEDSHLGYMSRQAPHDTRHKQAPPSVTHIRLYGREESSIPVWIVRCLRPVVNHSYAFDLLYTSGLVLWTVSFLSIAIHVGYLNARFLLHI